MDAHKKKMVSPILATICMVIYYIVYFVFLITLVNGIWKYIFGICPFVFTALMIAVCIERINEIKKGEEDDLSQY